MLCVTSSLAGTVHSRHCGRNVNSRKKSLNVICNLQHPVPGISPIRLIRKVFISYGAHVNLAISLQVRNPGEQGSFFRASSQETNRDAKSYACRPPPDISHFLPQAPLPITVANPPFFAAAASGCCTHLTTAVRNTKQR